MAALILLLTITLALFHWLANPVIGPLTSLLQGGWLPIAALLAALWLLAGRR